MPGLSGFWAFCLYFQATAVSPTGSLLTSPRYRRFAFCVTPVTTGISLVTLIKSGREVRRMPIAIAVSLKPLFATQDTAATSSRCDYLEADLSGAGKGGGAK